MKKIVLSSFIAMVTLLSCSKTGQVSDKTQTIVLPANGEAVINASNQVAFNFLQATLQQDPADNNKLISPLSIYLALSMVYNGADHATKDSIAQTLKISGIDINNLNAVCQSLITQLPKEDSKVQLAIANSIWYKKSSYQPLSSFLDNIKNYYDATIQPLNFEDPKSVNTINNWVAQKTSNKIPTILNKISPDDVMYLIDAIYFNGSWQQAFKASDTHNDVFHLANGSTLSTPFMKQQTTVRKSTNSSFSIIELPYGGGKSYSMYIVLPASQPQAINAFAAQMTTDLLTGAIGKMDTVNTEIDIPKWEYSYAIDDMRPALSQLGMGIAFGGTADFSKIYDPAQIQVNISKAIHKTYIKVNEEGTEAAAATVIGIGLTAVASPPVVKIDRPFLYSIIEKQTGTILFVGIVNNPAAK